MADLRDTQILSLTTTVATQEVARRLAGALVERRLAACVQLTPITESHYRWNGAPTAEPEVRLTVKTVAERLGAVQAFLTAEHPYALPELVWQLLEASPGYAAWVRQEVSAS
jgi:periplasmic divalent cation tolerance protein